MTDTGGRIALSKVKLGGSIVSVVSRLIGSARELAPLGLDANLDDESGFDEAAFRKELEKYSDGADYLHIALNDDPYRSTLYKNVDIKTHKAKDKAVVRRVLRACLDYRVPVQILTGCAMRCMYDMDLFVEFGKSIRVGQVFTGGSDKHIETQFDTLTMLKMADVPTMAYFAPVDLDAIVTFENCVGENLADYLIIGANADIFGIKAKEEAFIKQMLPDYKRKNNSAVKKEKMNYEMFVNMAITLVKFAQSRAYFMEDIKRLAPHTAALLSSEQTDMDANRIRSFAHKKHLGY